MNVPIIQVDI